MYHWVLPSSVHLSLFTLTSPELLALPVGLSACRQPLLLGFCRLFALLPSSSKYRTHVHPPRFRSASFPSVQPCSNSQLWEPAFVREWGKGTDQRKTRSDPKRKTPGRWLSHQQPTPGILDWQKEKPLVSERKTWHPECDDTVELMESWG